MLVFWVIAGKGVGPTETDFDKYDRVFLIAREKKSFSSSLIKINCLRIIKATQLGMGARKNGLEMTPTCVHKTERMRQQKWQMQITQERFTKKHSF